ncbi:LacI family transcriptional regulator [Paenibacillus rhizovicinus]|uniref:LacI family transcriptional regulator n=1 Tax=Paenibacillus rhizovicinus TaxID=2704463 RepID=A0A6C0P9E2_9BACL|nr:LacI family transcriptional regulator [Paenibacillus rhizovicinus]
MQKVTLQSIADKLNVSKALVSKALSNDPAVNEVTREVIWKTAEEVGYRIKSAKKSGTPTGSGNLALLMPRAYLDDPEYWGKIIKGIDKELESQSYSLLLSGLDVAVRINEGMPSSITENKVEGAIVLGQLPDVYTDQLKKKKLPFVLVDPSAQDPDIDMVLANNYQGAYQAANLLLAEGHRRLAFVGDADTTWSFAERFRGFGDAVQAFNAKRGDAANAASLVVVEGMGVSGTGMYTKPSFPEELQRRLTGDQPVTAMFCANDLIAIDSLAHFAGWGLECPRDVSVVSFDNLSLAELKEPQLTTVNVPMEEIGVKAAQLILERIAEPGKLPELVMISTTLVQRNSTQARQA